MIFAVGMPSPNTVCVPSFQRSHALQFLEAFRNSSNDACNGNKELIESSGTRLGMLVRCKIDSDGHIEWITRGNLRVDNRRGFVENFGRRRKSEYIACQFLPARSAYGSKSRYFALQSRTCSCWACRRSIYVPRPPCD